MTVDLKELEGKLKNILADLDAKEGILKEELRAIELVKHASATGGLAHAAASASPTLTPESAPESPAGGSAAQEEPVPQEESTPTEALAENAAPQESPVEQAVAPNETPAAVETVPETGSAPSPEPEPAPADPEKDSRPLREQLSGASPEDAVLAVLRSWDSRLKAAKIAEELIAAGYPFPSGNARDVVANVLEDMARDNKIKKVKTIKGTYFTLL